LIVSDRDKLFISNYCKQLTSRLKIKLNLIKAYRHQSNGQVERTNQILEFYLSNYCNYKQDNWYDLLPYAEFVYNNTKQSSILISPYKALTRSDINFYPESSSKTNQPTLNKRIESIQ
jgi:transposase InsO family protein